MTLLGTTRTSYTWLARELARRIGHQPYRAARRFRSPTDDAAACPMGCMSYSNYFLTIKHRVGTSWLKPSRKPVPDVEKSVRINTERMVVRNLIALRVRRLTRRLITKLTKLLISPEVISAISVAGKKLESC